MSASRTIAMQPLWSMPLVLRLLLCLLVLPASSCDATSVWLSGVDRETYEWQPISEVTAKETGTAQAKTRGAKSRESKANDTTAQAINADETKAEETKAKKTVAEELHECEAPGSQAADSVTDGPKITIARSEDSAVVAACMAAKGYEKVYSSRSSWL